MKTILFFTVTLFCSFDAELYAQKVNTWKGGAPGHECDWHFYKNWSLGTAPDEFQKVVIPDVSTTTQRYPILRNGSVELESLEIWPNAYLTVAGNARIVLESWENRGICEGCKERIGLETEETKFAQY